MIQVGWRGSQRACEGRGSGQSARGGSPSCIPVVKGHDHGWGAESGSGWQRRPSGEAGCDPRGVSSLRGIDSNRSKIQFILRRLRQWEDGGGELPIGNLPSWSCCPCSRPTQASSSVGHPSDAKRLPIPSGTTFPSLAVLVQAASCLNSSNVRVRTQEKRVPRDNRWPETSWGQLLHE